MKNVRSRVFYADIILINAARVDFVNTVKNAYSVRIMHHKVADCNILKRANFFALFLFRDFSPRRMNLRMRKYRKISVFKACRNSSFADYDFFRDYVFGIFVKIRVKAVLAQINSKILRAFFCSRKNKTALFRVKIMPKLVFKYLVFSAPGRSLNGVFSID